VKAVSCTDFSKKCEILAQVWIWCKDDNRRDDGWISFFEWHDLSLPLAHLAHNGYTTVNKDKYKFIEDTWLEYCELLHIDPEATYLSVKETFDRSGSSR